MRGWLLVGLLGACADDGPSTTVVDAAIVAPGWRSLPPLPGGPRQEHAVVAVAQKIYVIGGFDDRGRVLSSVEVLDTTDDRWATAPSLPAPLHHINAAAAGGKIYVAGALSGVGFERDATTAVLDPAGTGWTTLAAMPEPRGAAAVGAIDGVIYVAGGLAVGASPAVSAYDTEHDTWTPLAALPEPRDHAVGAAVGGLLYVIGGRQNSLATNSGAVSVLDPADGRWTTRAAMPTARGGAGGAVVGDRIVVCGGEGAAPPANVFRQCEIFATASGDWATLPDMIAPRHGMGAAAVGKTVYIPGGADRDGFGAVATADALTIE